MGEIILYAVFLMSPPLPQLTVMTDEYCADRPLRCFFHISPFLQLTVMSIIEIILYAVNAWICQKHLNLVDEGGAILIHFFGAIFGLAVSRAVNRLEVCRKQLLINLPSCSFL